MLKENEFERYRQMLLVIRTRLRGEMEQLTSEALDRSDLAGESRSPTHMADMGTDSFEQDFTLRFAENEAEVIEEINDALDRIDQGTYGLCEQCLEDGKSAAKSSILKTRLKAIPYTRYCIDCERKREELAL
ncbi:General stress protein 16O [Polystyrenella longa]|uniref:General stress protein 16O n=1 Tax=Polystyrenella longa TaxID=2528007 RepID=A0A518CPB4_9PLAN|nr:TraR/DksA C4-type zinc finger protein [Polystyrenella longa]QDU81058.1 General stress protein 16O [Polystyrenella longa]